MASITSHSPQETFALGRDYARTLRSGDVVALSGDLGAGKTHFVKGMAAGLGIDTEATSPTFTLIHEYAGGRLLFYHIDLYRLETEDEVLAIGIDDYLAGDGVTAVEWADKFVELMPHGVRWVRFQPLEGDRREISMDEP
jgi:tRNA threonylcarbamoyladenosine biosynthesis protein TsaE